MGQLLFYIQLQFRKQGQPHTVGACSWNKTWVPYEYSLLVSEFFSEIKEDQNVKHDLPHSSLLTIG